MQLFFQKSKIVCHLLVGLILLECTPALANGQEEEPRLDIEQVVFSDSLVYIYYTLTGSAGGRYQVSVSLKKRSDDSYQLLPANLMGDVGSHIAPGANKMIVWNSAKEIPGGLKKDDYYFVLAVDVEPESGSWISTPLVFIGGAALVGGVAALLLLKSESATNQPTSGFPVPPGRP